MTMSRAQLIDSLQRNLVDVRPREDGEKDEYVITKDSIIEVQSLPEVVPRRLIHYLSRRLEIEIHRIYHPV